MDEDAQPSELKLTLALRVGVTGRRALQSSAMPAVAETVEAILSSIDGELRTIADVSAAKAVYRGTSNGDVVPIMRIVSPLAEGADRIVAAAGASLGAELYFPLPFAQSVYEADFTGESLEVFQQLLAEGDIFELDGDRDDAVRRAESYQAVGRYVVGCSDFLIAIWDGQPARGIGGTGEIVSYAVQSGVPVWWIDEAGELPSKWLADVVGLNDLSAAPAGEAAWQAMRAWIGRIALPPQVAAPERDGPFGALAAEICRRWELDRPPVDELFHERKPSHRFVWRTYEAMMNIVAPPKRNTPFQLLRPAIPGETYWRQLHEAPDRLANAYGDRYRSSYVLIALLAFIALGASAMTGAVGAGVSIAIALIELAAVAVIAALVTLNQTHRWHERWITYRLLAELCRKQYALAALGRLLPGSDVARLASDPNDNDLPPRDVWVAWYFLAAARGAPFPGGSMREAKHRALEVGRSLIDEQFRYHSARKDRSQRAGALIKAGSELSFGATVVFAVAKTFAVYLNLGQTLQTVALFGAFLSAGAGALVGIRAYSEFSMLSRQSEHMLHALTLSSRDFEATSLIVDRPLSSRQIGQTLYLTTAAMMQDISGWAQLFRIKNIEAG